MGVYLNSGYVNFKDVRATEPYVDMSGIISLTVPMIGGDDRYLCVTRPSRFGKSITADMLCAFYDCSVDSSELFADLEISGDADAMKHMNQYHVLHLDIASFGSERLDAFSTVELIQKSIFRDIKNDYRDHPEFSALLDSMEDNSLFSTLGILWKITGRRIVFVIDEWDYLFRRYPKDEEGQKYFQHWISGLLKGKGYAAFAYMTGILPVKTYGSESILNMFQERSIVDAREFAPYTGFSEKQVRGLCEKYSRDFDGMKEWYDGYDVEGLSVYNPNSVAAAVRSGILDDYWAHSFGCGNLKHYLSKNFEGVKEYMVSLLNEEKVELDMTEYSLNPSGNTSAESILAELVHLGCLTFHGDAKGWVSIPNLEIKRLFELAWEMMYSE